jgi:hypothetical protein
MKYKILNASSRKEIEKQVNEHLAQGWQLHGGLAVVVVQTEKKVKGKTEKIDGTWYFQSMTKGV